MPFALTNIPPTNVKEKERMESPFPSYYRSLRLLGFWFHSRIEMKRRGKVELKRVEDKTSRQVSFSTRRTGLFKKARELSVLCYVEVALRVLSNGDRFYEFSSGDNSFSKIIERYWRHADPQNNAQQHVSTAKRDYPVTSTSSEGINVLHSVQRFLEGQIIEQLNFSDLVQLEKQLSASLIQIRKIKQEKRLMEELRQQQSMEIDDVSHEEQMTPLRLGLSNINEEVSFVAGEQMLSKICLICQIDPVTAKRWSRIILQSMRVISHLLTPVLCSC